MDLILKVLAFFFTFGASVEIQLRNESNGYLPSIFFSKTGNMFQVPEKSHDSKIGEKEIYYSCRQVV